MRVTIEHREETAGVAGNRRNYFIDCGLTFSEEERAIIKARDLTKHNFTLPAATPTPTKVEFVGYPALRTIARLMMVGGFVWALVASFQRGAEGPGTLVLFAGIALEIYAWRKTRNVDKRLDQPEQQLFLGKLLSDGRFTVYVVDPAHAKSVEEDIRNALVGIKQIIQGSAELSARQTFEL